MDELGELKPGVRKEHVESVIRPLYNCPSWDEVNKAVLALVDEAWSAGYGEGIRYDYY